MRSPPYSILLYEYYEFKENPYGVNECSSTYVIVYANITVITGIYEQRRRRIASGNRILPKGKRRNPGFGIFSVAKAYIGIFLLKN
jgi:hypothetical protein